MIITTFGAIIGLIVAIILIIKKFEPFYCLVFGALVGGLVGGTSLVDTVEYMASGAQSMAPAILRVMTSGFFWRNYKNPWYEKGYIRYCIIIYGTC